MVAGDEGDDGAFGFGESEDFGMEDEVLGVFVVGVGADEAAAFVEDGGDVEEEAVLVGHTVELAGFFEEAFAEEGDVVAVSGVGVVFGGEVGCGADDLGFEVAGEFGGGGEVVEESALEVGGGDVDVFEAEGLCDGEVDLEGREEGFGGVEVEVIGVGALVLGESAGFLAEFGEGSDGAAGFAGLEKEGGEELDFVAEEDEFFDLAVVEVGFEA